MKKDLIENIEKDQEIFKPIKKFLTDNKKYPEYYIKAHVKKSLFGA